MTAPRRFAAAAVVSLAIVAPATAQHVSIPFLAAPPQAGIVTYEGAECEEDAANGTLRCAFQQVFLTTDNAPPDTCMVTTNAYDVVFRRELPTRWVSRAAPQGVCGVVDTVVLEDGGGVRWTMTLATTATQKDAAPQCHAVEDTRDVMTWQDVRRRLPCTYVQPGGLRR